MTLQDLASYHRQQFQGKPFTYTVVASEKRIQLDDLKKYGEVRKLEVGELFGYDTGTKKVM